MAFLRFMSSSAGRVARGVAGAALVGAGLISGGAWLVLAVVGLVPLLAAGFDVCVFAPLGHMPFAGDALRSQLSNR